MLLHCKPLQVTVVITKSFHFLIGKFTSGKVLSATDFQHIRDCDYRQAEWVKILHENESHIGLVLEVSTSDELIRVKFSVHSQGKHWKLESERNSVCYSEYDVLGRTDNYPTMDRRGGLYKLQTFDSCISLISISKSSKNL